MKNIIVSIILTLSISACAYTSGNKAVPLAASTAISTGCSYGAFKASPADKAKVIKGLEIAIGILNTSGIEDLEPRIAAIDKSVAPYAYDIANWVIFLKEESAGSSASDTTKLISQSLNRCLAIFSTARV